MEEDIQNFSPIVMFRETNKNLSLLNKSYIFSKKNRFNFGSLKPNPEYLMFRFKLF